MDNPQLDIDISNNRMRDLYRDVLNSLSSAKSSYIANNLQEMEAHLRKADVESSLLIAERIDMLIKVLEIWLSGKTPN